MFGIARILIRNKVLVAGLVAVGIFLSSGDKQAPKPPSPWAAGASSPVVASEGSKTSLTDKALTVVDSAPKMAGVEEYSPSALKEQAVGGFVTTDAAIKNAGGN